MGCGIIRGNAVRLSLVHMVVNLNILSTINKRLRTAAIGQTGNPR